MPAGSLEAEELRFQANGPQHRGCIIPQAVTKSSAPEDGRDHRPKHVELFGIINKPLLLQLVGVYIIYINDAWSNKYQILNRVLQLLVQYCFAILHLFPIEFGN